MMKKILIPIIALMPFFPKAQVTVSVQLPSAGMIQKDQLWNLVAVNNTNEILETTVLLTLQDAVTGQTVLSAGSRNFTLGKGIKVITSMDVQPVQYNYLAAEFTSGYIPLGSYIACYRIIKIKGEGTTPLADECVRLNISPLSPPLLSTPADKAELQTIYPQFSWMPPSPSEMFNNLSYDIAVTEVLQGQSASEAILNNMPVYTNGNIKNPFENYPSSFSSLQPGKLYAWQVTARNGLNYSAQTEVWTFTLQTVDSSKVTPINTHYISLENGESGGINFISDKNLLIKYYSFYKEHETTAKIFSQEGGLVQEIKQKIVYGDNFLSFKVNRSIREGKIYTLEIIDPQRVKHSVRFSIQKSNPSN